MITARRDDVNSPIMAVVFVLLILLGLTDAQAGMGAHDGFLPTAAQAQGSQNPTLLFDADWRFHRGGAQRAEQPDFDDSQWRKLDLPHDWSIEDVRGTHSPF